MDVDFEAALFVPLFLNQITTLELTVLYNIIVFSKYLDQHLSFQGSNIFVGTLEVVFWLFKEKKISI